ncbi:MAG TPA: hypothetical protein EYQ60_04675 [Myxococcales bacterium]|nr:hypothetical protein [Myxococcales bacterium]
MTIFNLRGAITLLFVMGVVGIVGVGSLVIQSDPNAAGFYEALGSVRKREIPSSIPGVRFRTSATRWHS